MVAAREQGWGDLVAYVSNERGIGLGEGHACNQRRIRLGVGLTGQQFLDYTPALIAGGEKQIDVGGVLGESARYQKVTGDHQYL